MVNAVQSNERQRKQMQKSNHKASYDLRKLRRNRRGVWVSK